MASLESRLRSELGNWRTRLPATWRPHFDGVDLDFDAVDRGTTLAAKDRIWPQETNAGRPAGAHLFKAFRDCAPKNVRVVVFGNDPYTRLQQATGRSFEQGDLTNWKKDLHDPKSRFSPSLKTVIAAALATTPKGKQYPLVDERVVFNAKEFKSKGRNRWEYGRTPLWISDLALQLCIDHSAVDLPPPKRIFGHWAKQGVLWINRTLTYTRWDDVNKSGHRRSHQLVWKPFTERVIEVLVDSASRDHRIIFALWGSEANEIGKTIRRTTGKKSTTALRFVEMGHPQWTENFFRNGINPLAEINKVIQGRPIQWT